MTIKAVQTHYKHWFFRSRTEARWAVFFDTLKIRWEYERERFAFDNGITYLPDFFIHTRGGLWAEIKGKPFTAHERRLCELLAVGTQQPVLLLDDVPAERAYTILMPKGGAVAAHPFPFSGLKVEAAVTAACSARFERYSQ